MADAMFVDRLHDIVAQSADQPAVVDRGDSALTYGALWSLSGNIASTLQESGIGPESVVGISLPKSAEFIATVIACWRLRAAYVPLDPDLPADRLRQMTEDAEPAFVVAHSTGCQPVTGADKQAGSLCYGGVPSDLAWIIFTSGSTGRPRGVAVEHRGFVNVIDAQRSAFGMDASSRVLLLYSTSFDASLSDIGTALLSGAALCLEDTDTIVQAGTVFDVIRKRGITHADIPPSLLSMHHPDEAPECLKTVVIGGEVCPPDTVRAWAERVRLINVYGPTEATICTSLCECRAEDWERPLLGQPIPGVEYLVVGENDQPVARSQVGELLIAGDCLARHYVKRPEETQRRFLMQDDVRYYRTGDRVLYDSDGEYVFLGRIDRQVKIRGVRIELEEIESAIQQISGVRRCAVVNRGIRADSTRKQLVAFVESEPGLCEDSLRDALRRKLPQSMWPSRLEFVSRIPVTASGKTDWTHLESCPLSETKHAEAEKPSTELLLSVFRSVLENESIGSDDDFFDQGGDSLSVLAASAAAQAQGLSVSPQSITRHRTVARLLDCLQTTAPVDVRTANWLRDDITRCERTVLETGNASETSSRFQRDAQLEPLAVRPRARQFARPLTRHGSQLRELVYATSNPTAIPRTVLTDSLVVVPRRVLMTGATGFLGSRVLVELLRQTDAQVVCIVRSRDDEAAARRLRTHLSDQQLAADWSRVRAIAGDVAEPRLGLSPHEWNGLVTQVDTVIHCAARVHMLESYEQLRPANVTGTAHVVRFATSGRLKRLHYASTLSVFVGTDRNHGTVRENDDLSETNEVYGGYAQSKWAAEVLLRNAGLANGQLDIYRFGLLTADTRSGLSPEHDLFPMTIRGLSSLGCVPLDATGLRVDITPVDYAAKAMVALATDASDHRNSSRTWHIANPEPLAANTLFDVLATTRPSIKRVPADEFLDRVRNNRQGEQAAACLSLSRWLSSDDDNQLSRPLDLFQATGVEFDASQTRPALEKAGLTCPRADRKLVAAYINHILHPTNGQF